MPDTECSNSQLETLVANALRILHVFPSFELGGSQRRMTTYLNATKSPHSHLIYAMDGRYDAAELTDHFTKANLPEGAIPKGDTLHAVKACRALLAKVKPDLLVTYNWGSIEWTLANRWPKRAPMIHIQDGFAEDEQISELPNRRRMRRFAYRKCDRVVVPSRQLEAQAAKNWKIPENRLSYVPNGIDCHRFQNTADGKLLSQYGLTPDDMIIGTVARLTPEKNIGRLIEAFSTIENKHAHAKLVIVGDGIGMSALKMLAERICEQERVIFTGKIDMPETIVPAFDVFALSSDTEQMPISVLEAMAASKPVVSTDVGDVKTMVAAENRSFIEGREAPEIAASLDILLSDPALASSIGSANAAIVEAEFSLQKMVDTYDQLFSSKGKL